MTTITLETPEARQAIVRCFRRFARRGAAILAEQKQTVERESLDSDTLGSNTPAPEGQEHTGV